MFEIDFKFHEPFTLESGEVLDSLELRCTIYGNLNADKSNAVLVFHALTGSSRIGDWWNGIIGEGKALDTSKFAFVCVNNLGSCYGSTPASRVKSIITTRDVVKSNIFLLEYLGIEKFEAVIGGSVGGMLALQFAADFPNLTRKCVAIGATPLSAMGLALNHLQRQALQKNDIEMARKIAMVSYKSANLFDVRFARKPNRNGEKPSEKVENRFDIAGYLDYQGEIFSNRFEIESYKTITKMMDLFELEDEEIRRITAKTYLVGISSDWLFPSSDVKQLAGRFSLNEVNTQFIELTSGDGHDAFLSDVSETTKILSQIFAAEKPKRVLTNQTILKSDLVLV
jgi:homoserine O-acetyltransferase/O-succinyltransferase